MNTSASKITIPSTKVKRCNFYIDGFNVYHDIQAKFGNIRNKLNYYEFFKSLVAADPTAKINTICYFTTLNHQNLRAQVRRHINYIKVLKDVYGIEVQLGEFAYPSGFKPVENLTDVNLAARLVFDACKSSCEEMFLYSNDADFRPAVQAALAINKNLRINVISPASREKNNPKRARNNLISTIFELKKENRADVIWVERAELKKFLFTKRVFENLDQLTPQVEPPATPAIQQHPGELKDRNNRINFYIHGNDVQEKFASQETKWLDYDKFCATLASKIGGQRERVLHFATPRRGERPALQRYARELAKKDIRTINGYYGGEAQTQEKLTATNIAAKMIVDAHRGICKNICLITNDDNLAAAIKYTRLASSQVNVYLVVIEKENTLRNKNSFNKFSVDNLEKQILKENTIRCTAEVLRTYMLPPEVIKRIETGNDAEKTAA